MRVFPKIFSRLWSREKEPEVAMIPVAEFNKDMDPLPARYPKPAKSFLTILQPGGGSRIIPVKEISTEQIVLPDKSTRYTGVDPDLTHHKLAGRLLPGRKWETVRMHHSIFGWPFTFNPRTFEIFSHEKKRRILIARGAGIPVEVGDRTVVVLIDPATQGTDDPRPIWQPEEITADEKKKLFKDQKLVSFFQLETWVKANLQHLEKMEVIQLPVATIYDVSDMEMLRAETFQFLESKVMEKGFKSMEQLGEGKDLFWYFVTLAISIVGMAIIFLVAADQGVFGV